MDDMQNQRLSDEDLDAVSGGADDAQENVPENVPAPKFGIGERVSYLSNDFGMVEGKIIDRKYWPDDQEWKYRIIGALNSWNVPEGNIKRI